MLGLLLASSIIVQCTVVNFHPQPTLICNDRQQSVLTIPYNEWPEAWHGPELGFTYSLLVTAQDGGSLTGTPIASVRDERALAESIRRSRNEQLRWQRPALQNPRREQ